MINRARSHGAAIGEFAQKLFAASPLTFPRLALEIWEAIKDEDWVLTANDLKHEVRKYWDFDKPYRHPQFYKVPRGVKVF